MNTLSVDQQFKQQIGKSLIGLGDLIPTSRPLLSEVGLRTKKEWFGDRIVEIPLPTGESFKLASVAKNYLSFQLFWRGVEFYEPITRMVAQELTRDAKTFVDVGAHVGFFSLVIGVSRPHIKVISFEPNPANRELLLANVAATGLKNFTCEAAAVSDADGTALLHMADSDMSASLRSDFESHQRPPVEVKTVSLDSHFTRNPIQGPALFKIDVEGHETAVFQGARKTFSTLKPDIITEVAVTHTQSPAAHLREIGYRFYQITDQGFIESDGCSPYIRGNLLFLNYLLTVRTPDELARLFEPLKSRIAQIDLSKTSKFVDIEHIHRARRQVSDAPTPQSA